MSTQTSQGESAIKSSPLGPLGGLAEELDKIAPRFEINASDIEILKDPAEFFDVLKSKILSAKSRIYLSTLYVGTSEHELIATLQTALRRTPSLKLSILTDALRGTREEPNPSCASLLAPLVKEFGDERVEIRMFHTPNLVGFKKRYLPKRINEGWGLQHMKLYGIDDEIIMSGANLSSDYFTNRQDRYHLFRSAPLTAYYARIHDAVCAMSFAVHHSPSAPGFVLSWPTSNPGPSPLDDAPGYIAHAASTMRPLLLPSPQPAPPRGTTVIYPVFQFTPFYKNTTDPSTELPALRTLLTALLSPPLHAASWTFTAGYFNMTPGMRDMLLAPLLDRGAPPTAGTVITAHPAANGFFASRGVSGMLPAAYTLLARRFVEHAARAGLSPSPASSSSTATPQEHSTVTLKEWRNGTVNTPDGWSYHAKGLWVGLPAEAGPCVAVVGSSNYTARSHTLDLEANAVVLTRDADLQKRLKGEIEHLGEHAKDVGPDEFARTERRVGLPVRIAMGIVRLVGGAL